MDSFVLLGKILLVFALVLLNGFFVAAEFALVKVRSTQLETLARSGSSKARLAQHIVSRLDSYLSATQLGITMTSLGLGWAGEPMAAAILEPFFQLFGIQSHALLETISFSFGFVVITYLHIVLGEQAPKWLAIQRAQGTALFIARPLNLFYLAFRPFITVVNSSANRFLRFAGFQPVAESDLFRSEEELRLLLGHNSPVSAIRRKILLNTMDIQNRMLREIMVPRTSIVFLNIGRPLEENFKCAFDNQFTRYPLCDGNLDNVQGMIHVKDLFRLKDGRGEGTTLLEVKREILFVPETTPVEKCLATILAKRVLMAIVVDEYGGTAGLVTLENLIEELVGDIRDEFDVESSLVQKVNDNEFVVDGALPLYEFSSLFGIDHPSKDVVTLNGFVLRALGRLPEKGRTVQIGPWTGTVEQTDGKRVRTLRLTRLPAQSEQEVH